MDGGEEPPFLDVVARMKLLSLWPNLAKERRGTSCHTMSQKDQKIKRKLTFDIPKFKFQNGLKQKTSSCWAFLRQTGL